MNQIKASDLNIKPNLLGQCKYDAECTSKILFPNDICRDHQTKALFRELIETGHNICKEWLRGCFNEVINTKSCDKCLSLAGSAEKKIRLIVKEKNIDLIAKELKMCHECKITYNLDHF